MENRKLVLVADDSVTARGYISSILEREGYNIVQAESGSKALDLITELKPSCLILDLLMPDMNGFEVLQSLKERNIELSVLVLSADIQDEVRKECFDLGAKSFLNKPFNEKEILDTVAGIIK